MTQKPEDTSTSQRDKFKEAAREVEADDDEKRFDERLKQVAKAPANPRDRKKDERG
jgi:hypothetical protein